jgi:acetylornithine deacetylase/succinyl-diaminopimelate desuccinylase-like protein
MHTQSPPSASPDLPPLLPQTERAVARLMAAPAVAAALAAAERDAAVTLGDQVALSEIESPPFHEEVRAADFARRLRELGLSDVRIDAEGNVIGVRPGSGGGPHLALAAHLDTVFAAGTDVKVRRDGERYLGPGISDNARGLAVLLQVLRTLDEQGFETIGDLLFVGTVGEEGNGDLRGCKALFATDNAIDGFIAVDGVAVTRILAHATGSRRYRVGYEGPGGHSYNAFGNPSATHALGRAIAAISELRVPDEPRTTFTVGTVKGGTTVNSIAASAEMELDMRSDDGDGLARLEAEVLPLLEAAAAAENRRWNAPADKEVKLVLTPIGNRPAGRQAPESPVLQAARAAQAALGIPLQKYSAASTDHNVPVSLGIPATTLGGGGVEGNNHSLREWYEPTRGWQGPQLTLLTALALVGVVGVNEPLLPVRSPGRAQ